MHSETQEYLAFFAPTHKDSLVSKFHSCLLLTVTTQFLYTLTYSLVRAISSASSFTRQTAPSNSNADLINIRKEDTEWR